MLSRPRHFQVPFKHTPQSASPMLLLQERKGKYKQDLGRHSKPELQLTLFVLNPMIFPFKWRLDPPSAGQNKSLKSYTRNPKTLKPLRPFRPPALQVERVGPLILGFRFKRQVGHRGGRDGVRERERESDGETEREREGGREGGSQRGKEGGDVGLGCHVSGRFW